MRKLAVASLLSATLLSGCVFGTDTEFPDVVPQTFESFPYEPGGIVCRTPVPAPGIGVVARTVRVLAGPGGRIAAVPLSSGVAFGIWTSRSRAKVIRTYFRDLSRKTFVPVTVRLSRVDRSRPYLTRSLSVPTRQAFLAARFQEGTRTLSAGGFFTRSGPHFVPVFSLEERAPGWFACRSSSPGDPDGKISISAGRATIRAGADILTIEWEDRDAKK